MINVVELIINKENNECEFNFIDSISDDKEKLIKEFSDNLFEFQKILNNLENLKYNYDQLYKILNTNIQDTNSYKVLVDNYLSSYKKFIDIWEKDIKNNFNFLEDYFLNELKNIYDKFFEYRFIYNLRNFSQHCGDVISDIEYSAFYNPKIMVNKVDILKNHKKIQLKFKEELNSRKEELFDLVKIINIVHNRLLKFHEDLIIKILNENQKYSNSALNVATFYNYYSKKKGELLLTRKNITELINKEKLDYIYIPRNIALIILKNGKSMDEKINLKEIISMIDY